MAGETGGKRQDGAMGPGSARFLFRSFKRILACNTAALERMAQMDRALGGEYVFDKAFLDTAVRDVCRLTHQAAYHLNGMAGEGYVELYDAFLAVKDALEDILAGGMGPLAGRNVLDFSEIGWEMEPLAGLCSVGLAVLGGRMGLAAPDGMAVTVTGMGALAGPEHGAALAEVEAGARTLFTRLGGRNILELSLVAAGPDGGGWILDTAFADSAEAAAQAALRFARERAAPDGTLAPRSLAVCVRPLLDALAVGTLQTLAHDPNLPPAMLAVAHPPQTPDAGDRIWLSRPAPHDPLRMRVSPKPLDAALPGGKPLDLGRGRSLRGSAWLAPDKAALLAEMGLAAERALGGPCRLSWALDAGGGVWLTGVEPVASAFPEWDEEAETVFPAREEVLLEGGQIACGGVGAGPVVPVGEDTRPEAVPLGCVGVARAATPALSRLVPRLGALLAEVGTPASHLATVARENRVPALFGLKGAATLEPGALVTVDADQGAVYRGVAEGLLRQAAVQEIRAGSEPEYQVLRRLLRHIRPLDLVDPSSRDFDPDHCRTCHDIIHFAHEKAVDLLLAMDTAGKGGLGAPRRLQEDSPFDLGILDVDGGLSDGSGPVTLAQVLSLPLRAFLEGLLLRDVRRQIPGRLSIGDIVAGLDRTYKAMDNPASGQSLAIAAKDYANITLRLGYHFSVVDAVVSDRPEHTFVYFRFAGGFADSDRRARRAELILAVLARLGFSASRKGDLVVGKRKLMEAGEALDVLRFLGALSAYTRQLDVELASEGDVAHFVGEFLEACGLGAPRRGGPAAEGVVGEGG